MSKESIIKKRLDRLAKEQQKTSPTPRTQPQERAAVAPELLPQRPRRRRLSRKFLITCAIWVIALIVALFFLSR